MKSFTLRNPAYFAGKTVVVTGGSEGIGRALVEQLLLAGACVATCGRNYDKLYQLQVQNSDRPLFTMVADVSVETDCEHFITATVKNFGGIDVLINNAGISMRAEFKEVQLQTLKQLMDINFWGAVYCTKYAMPYLLERRGDIVGISSIAGYRGLPGRSGYSASKWALQGWLEALRTELLETGVNVMWVCPGFTTSNIRNVALNKDANPQGESPMNEKAMMSAEECSMHILNAISARQRTLVLTWRGKQTVLLNKWWPTMADKLTRRFFYKQGQLAK
ncbi:MAG TPA: SDR family oxidoreductase [Phnomibacter sp.]|nr:SDR family oxidoreductase [Phnomibacter sp.]